MKRPTAKTRPLLAGLLIALAPFSTAMAQGQAPCWFTPEQINQALGTRFGKGEPEAATSAGHGCYYRAADKSYLFVNTVRLDGAPPAMMRKLLGGGGKAVPIAGDPDNATTLETRADVPPFPDLAYERKGYLVLLSLPGMVPATTPRAQALRESRQWAEKMASKLPRVP
jgi:hypothetical protein